MKWLVVCLALWGCGEVPEPPKIQDVPVAAVKVDVPAVEPEKLSPEWVVFMVKKCEQLGLKPHVLYEVVNEHGTGPLADIQCVP